MKTTKDILLPKVPSDLSPEMVIFYEGIIKAIKKMNLNVYMDLQMKQDIE